MGPGPSSVDRRVLEALAKPIVGHLDPQFLALMNEIQDMLRSLYRTENRLTISVSGTGSAGMETTFVNLVEPGDEVLVFVNGVFGNRMSDIVERIGGKLTRIDRPWGEVFEPQEIADALAANPGTKVVAIVHAETSTGAHQPLEELGKICHDSGALLLVDCVTSLGGAPVEIDAWGVDAAYSGTQKCLSCPPGLSPVTFSERAVEKMRARSTKPVSWYLDVSMIEKYWTEGSRVYHHTAPINMNYALHQALAIIEEEGLEERHVRHTENSATLVRGLEALGFRLFAQEGHRLPMLNAVWLPDGVDDAKFRGALLNEHNIEVGGGLGEVAGKIWRIGLMGEASRRENVFRLLGAIEELLYREGISSEVGAGIAAAALVRSG